MVSIISCVMPRLCGVWMLREFWCFSLCGCSLCFDTVAQPPLQINGAIMCTVRCSGLAHCVALKQSTKMSKRDYIPPYSNHGQFNNMHTCRVFICLRIHFLFFFTTLHIVSLPIFTQNGTWHVSSQVKSSVVL